ncbi:hypothetical protein L6164_007619 [Bauhinia variegata]|uniref:Uncharacterized protein n=1 Tax=Bauhinia variegata TaxID=167791 RepID=A0ACB9PFN7_BAUVA|nr:hypothetical protein L6164_007619 [Bauhinia variegata]
MLTFQSQFHKPASCLYKVGYWPFPHGLNVGLATETSIYRTLTHSLNTVSMPQEKVSQKDLLIGSTRFDKLPLAQDMVPSFESGFGEEEEDGDDDDDNDEYIQEGEDGDTSFASKLKLPPCGEVVDDKYQDMVHSAESGFCKEEEEDDDDVDDNDEYIQGREDGHASFVSKLKLPPWGEVVDDKCQDSMPTDTPLSTLEETELMGRHGALILEETDEGILSNRILVLSRTNKVRSALEYFKSMETSGLCPSRHACNSLIFCLLRNGWFDDGLKVFDFARRRKITTGHSYSLILKALAKAQRCNLALNLFWELESESDTEKDFDAVVYNTMISICGEVHNWIEVERIWRKMKVNECVGTRVTYCLLVSSFVRCGQSELALDAYHEMVQNGFKPGNDTLQALISTCTREGKWDAALQVFQEMLKGELKPNLIACNAMINSLGKAGELKLAFQVYRIMKSLGHKPDAYTFNSLLGALNKASRHHDALQFFEKIERNETSQLNIHLYNTVLVSCSKLGFWERALQILWQMEASGLPPLTVSYNLVISACEVARKPKIAFEVYKHMIDQKCNPDTFTYLSLIRCCIWGSLWEELEEVLKLVSPNASLYNAAVQGLCLRREIGLAKKLYQRMREIGLQPNGKTRALMLKNLSKIRVRRK